MPTEAVTLTEAKQRLGELVAGKKRRTLQVRLRDGSVVTLIQFPARVDDDELEEAEMLADPETMRDFKRGVAEMQAGKGVPLDEAIRQLGIKTRPKGRR